MADLRRRRDVGVRTLTLPSSMILLDAGTNWVLVRTTDDLDIQGLAVYSLVAG